MGTSSPLLYLPAPLLPRPRCLWFPTAARPPLAFPLVVYHAKHTVPQEGPDVVVRGLSAPLRDSQPCR